MLAVVQISGNQFKITKDQNLFIPHVDAKVGDVLNIKDILLIDNEGKVSLGNPDNKIVKIEVLKHVLGDKVIAFKMKRRKGFRKKKGHRTHYTQVKVVDIV